MEGVLEPSEDREIIEKIFNRYIASEKHFATPYPYPAMSVSDPSWKKHTEHNCWGYFSQGLIALRCTRWMDKYGYTKEMDYLCRQFIKGWTDCFDYFKLGQELDPITGQPSISSEWYSSTMLMYLYSAKRLGLYQWRWELTVLLKKCSISLLLRGDGYEKSSCGYDMRLYAIYSGKLCGRTA